MVVKAWPFLVGGLNCLVKSDNEQDLFLLFSLGGSDKIGKILLSMTSESQNLAS